jgi:hypothetical protein
MLVIQHLKGYIPSDVSVLKLKNLTGDTLFHAGSHGVILAEGGALCLMQSVARYLSYVSFSPNPDSCRQKGVP